MLTTHTSSRCIIQIVLFACLALPALADGMLYTLGERLAVGLVKPTPAGHEVVSRFELVP